MMSCWEGLVLRFGLLAYTAITTAPAIMALMAQVLADSHGVLSVGMPVLFKPGGPLGTGALCGSQLSDICSFSFQLNAGDPAA